jgi:hypothetical protein
VTRRFRVEERASLEGTAVWYVVDGSRGDKPTGEFDSREAAEAHADKLESADENAPIDPDADAGPIHTNP